MTPDELAELVEEACLDGCVTIPSMNPATPDIAYRLTVIGDWPEACTCPGYAGHGHCRHLDIARDVWRKTVEVGTVLTEENEQKALAVHRTLDYSGVSAPITTVLWLPRRPTSDYEVTVTLERRQDAVVVTVSEQWDLGEPVVHATATYGEPLPRRLARETIDFPPARRVLYDFVTLALTGEPVSMPRWWTP